jgi:uncharacterized protein
LGCDYCFQNLAQAPAGSHAPPRITRRHLDPEGVAKIIAFVQRQQRQAERPHTRLLLFGGEPLLNVSGAQELLRGFARLGLVDAGVVTNGVLLSEHVADVLVNAGLQRLQITFDGARESHDHIRVTRAGRPTYDTILANVLRTAERHPELEWNIRVNVSHHSLVGLDSLVDDLQPLPMTSRAVYFHLALIDDTGLGYSNDLHHGGLRLT